MTPLWKRERGVLIVILLIECLAIVLGFLGGIVWYPHIHQCLLFSWNHVGTPDGSVLLCRP